MPVSSLAGRAADGDVVQDGVRFGQTRSRRRPCQTMSRARRSAIRSGSRRRSASTQPKRIRSRFWCGLGHGVFFAISRRVSFECRGSEGSRVASVCAGGWRARALRAGASRRADRGPLRRRAAVGQQRGRGAVEAGCDRGEKDVLGASAVVPEPFRERFRQLEQSLGLRRDAEAAVRPCRRGARAGRRGPLGLLSGVTPSSASARPASSSGCASRPRTRCSGRR